MNGLVKDALVLTAITLVAGTVLGGVYEITKEPIAQANEKAEQEAYMSVFPDASSFAEVENFSEEDAAAVIADTNAANGTSCDVTGCVTAQDSSGATMGYVITMTSHSGYGGDITFSMGVANDGTLNGYSITDISESPGLGMKSEETEFMSQFENVADALSNTFTVTKTGSTTDYEIDAITGATITSKAVTYAVDAGLVYANTLIAEGGE